MTAKKHEPPNIPPAEWAVAALGALLVVTAIVVLTLDAFKNNDGQPPIISFAVDTVLAAGPTFVVKVTARNRGDETAAAVVIEGVLTDQNGAVTERSEVTLDYLPAGSSRTVGLIYGRDPRAHRVTVRALGYQEP